MQWTVGACVVEMRDQPLSGQKTGMQVLSASDCLNEKEKEAMIISSLMTEEQTLGLYFDFNGP